MDVVVCIASRTQNSVDRRSDICTVSVTERERGVKERSIKWGGFLRPRSGVDQAFSVYRTPRRDRPRHLCDIQNRSVTAGTQ